jgi:geranylgeranyl transferase type-2 subunit alpha
VETYLHKIISITQEREVLDTFLQKECDMAEKIIQKNFSNYSAWHYRGKLMPRLYERTKSRYVLPIERIKEDLELLKHAFFTEPKD